jgi:hypothetical protein
MGLEAVHDLSGSMLEPFLTTTTGHTKGDSSLCVALMGLRLKANEPDFVERVCALVEGASRRFEKSHLGTPAPHDHLRIFEDWVDHRRWIADQLTAAIAEVQPDVDIAPSLVDMRARTKELSGKAMDERFRVGTDHPMTVKRPYAPHGDRE